MRAAWAGTAGRPRLLRLRHKVPQSLLRRKGTLAARSRGYGARRTRAHLVPDDVLEHVAARRVLHDDRQVARRQERLPEAHDVRVRDQQPVVEHLAHDAAPYAWPALQELYCHLAGQGFTGCQGAFFMDLPRKTPRPMPGPRSRNFIATWPGRVPGCQGGFVGSAAHDAAPYARAALQEHFGHLAWSGFLGASTVSERLRPGV